MVQILPWLYVGSCHSGSDSSPLKELGIKTVINVHGHPDLVQDGVEYHQVSLIDGPGNGWDTILEVLGMVDDGRRGGSVLIHCCGGLSRSPFIALSYLVVKEGMGLDSALSLISSRHPSHLINPVLIDVLRQNALRGGRLLRV